MIDGHETLRSIEQALREVERKERKLQDTLHDSKTELGGLMSRRVGLFRALAEQRAKDAVSDGVINEADRLSFQVANSLKARQNSLNDLENRYVEAGQEQNHLLSQNEKAIQNITALELKLDQVAERAIARLSSKAIYQDLKREHEKAQSIYDKADLKTKQTIKDRATKGLPYESDPLFMYLWTRKYGKAGYEANNLVRYLDQKVAALVGYHDARPNYAMLLEIPERLKAHRALLAMGVGAARQRLDEMEAKEIRTIAGADLNASLTKARTKLDQQNQALEKIRTQLTEVSNQINLYAEGLDRSFQTAVSLSAKFLQGEDLKRLRALARTTAAPTDDEIVSQIQNTDKDIAELRRRDKAMRHKLEKLFEKKEELIRIASDFRRNRYHEPGSIFDPGSDLGGLLVDVLEGALSGEQYWGHTRRSQKWRTRPADPFRRHSGFPGLGDSWGGGWGKSSGNAGGDFKTGGGF